MLRLGHIDYSNCFPVHAELLDRGPPTWIELRRGIPSVLNAALREGSVEVAPSSSIEFARNADRYRILPDFTIAAHGAVRSIRFETDRSLADLDGALIALPTASATSVVLLRALLEIREGVQPRYRWFEQGESARPLEDGADAALWIGDVALRRHSNARAWLDLGEEWLAWTGLPFVFALWQTNAGSDRDGELAELHALLRRSLDYFRGEDAGLARRHAGALRLDEALLLDYWRQLRYTLDDAAMQGLRRFYELAERLGEVPSAPTPCWTPRGH